MMRDYREKRGITQTHVAKQAGINPKRISQLETGLVRLTADEFLQSKGIDPEGERNKSVTRKPTVNPNEDNINN